MSAELLKALEACVENLDHAGINTSLGYCCCGDPIDGHASPMVAGHTPIDAGDYAADQAIQLARRAIAAWNTRAAQPEAEPVVFVGPDGGTPLTRRDQFWYEQGKLVAPKPSQWQPIETAPKDGTKILVLTVHGDVEIGEWCVMEKSHYEHVEGDMFRKVMDEPTCFWNNNYPKLWMPLPPAPDCGEKGAPTDAEMFRFLVERLPAGTFCDREVSDRDSWIAAIRTGMGEKGAA